MADSKKKRIIEYLIALLGFAVFVFGFELITGTLTSGWHFADDHEYETILLSRRAGESFLAVFRDFQSIFPMRYRPLYYVFRIAGNYLFGDNLLALSIVHAIYIVLGMLLLYVIARQLETDCLYAALFALIAYVGYQSANWWKLGPQEAVGCLGFLGAWLLIILWVRTGKSYYGVLSLPCIAIMTNYKEVFFLLIPFLCVFICWEEFPECASITEIWSERGRIKKYLWFIILNGVYCVIMLSYILLFVGTSMAGMDNGIHAASTIKVWWYAIRTDLKFFALFGVLLTILLLSAWKKTNMIWKDIVLAISFIVPVCALYMENEMTERYILPFSIGYALFFVVLLSRQGIFTGVRKGIYLLMLFSLLIFNLRGALIEADYYRWRGQSITTALKQIEAAESAGISVLTCFGISNPEAEHTVETYLEVRNLPSSYYWHEDSETITDKTDYSDEEGQTVELDGMGLVAMFNGDDRHYSQTPSIDLSGFEKVTCGTIDLFYRSGLLDVPVLDITPAYYYR